MESIYFRSKFWDSPNVLEQEKNTKLLYFYLITNESIKPSGIYMFFREQITYHTKLSTKEINNALKQLIRTQKVFVHNNWLFVVEFLNETFNLEKKTLSPKIKSSIASQFKSKIPKELIYCFDYFYHTHGIPYNIPYNIPYIKPLGILIKILDFRLEILDFSKTLVTDFDEEEAPKKKCVEHGEYMGEECDDCSKISVFEQQFWPIYPFRNGKKLDKPEALEQFLLLPKKDIDSVLIAVRNYQISKEVKEGVGIKNAFRWLRDKKYKDWLLPEQPTNKPLTRKEQLDKATFKQ